MPYYFVYIFISNNYDRNANLFMVYVKYEIYTTYFLCLALALNATYVLFLTVVAAANVEWLILFIFPEHSDT